MDDTSPGPPPLLEQISTRWPLISDPVQFVLRYAPAMRSYLGALVKDPHDAEDVAQSFLARMMDRPITPDRVAGGRFRDYLKAALRNAAISHFRRRPRQTTADLGHIAAPEVESAADRAFLDEWRNCVLQRSWEALEQHERKKPNSLAFTVLRLAADYPNEDSAALAARAAAKTGRPLRSDAFRKQLSRARRRFAKCIVDAVRQTLERLRPEDVIEELSELGLMEYVRDFLPQRFR